MKPLPLILNLRLRQPVSGLTHLAGAMAAAVGLFALLAREGATRTLWHTTSLSVFGVTMIFLYLASSLYHLLPLSERGIARLRKLDHMMIFVFIAGTYTPFCLLPLREGPGLVMALVIWAAAVAGILMKLFWLETSRWLRVAPYVAMGAAAIVIFPDLTRTLPPTAIYWLLSGAASYALGAVVYATKWPDPLPEVVGFHELWHCFVLVGSFCHFWVVREYVAGF